MILICHVVVLSQYFVFPDAPVCTTASIVIVGASLEESISIPCRIIADPSFVTFEWTFSSSGERFEVPHGHYATVQQPDGGLSAGGVDTRNSAIESNETHASESIGMFLLFFFFCFYPISIFEES